MPYWAGSFWIACLLWSWIVVLRWRRRIFRKSITRREDRIYLGNSRHDLEHGCYITGADKRLPALDYRRRFCTGNMQDESYFGSYKKEIKTWLRVKPAYDCMEYSRENLCIINIRGGEYTRAILSFFSGAATGWTR